MQRACEARLPQVGGSRASDAPQRAELAAHLLLDLLALALPGVHVHALAREREVLLCEAHLFPNEADGTRAGETTVTPRSVACLGVVP